MKMPRGFFCRKLECLFRLREVFLRVILHQRQVLHGIGRGGWSDAGVSGEYVFQKNTGMGK